MRKVIVIPARMISRRFPGKPLCDLLGKPMIQWVVEACNRVQDIDEVIVATPDREINATCQRLSVRCVMTDPDHLTGTDRVAEVAQQVDADIYINVQADEPLIEPKTIEDCYKPLIEDSTAEVSSVYCDCRFEELNDPTVVKVVLDKSSNALYFSRQPIPHTNPSQPARSKKHMGIYAFRKDPLIQFPTWAPGPLELAESVEPLRFLEQGIKLKMSYGQPTEVSVDIPEQAEEVRNILQNKRYHQQEKRVTTKS